jgi:LmbE family N-acetylglucosaminyl deacetylase
MKEPATDVSGLTTRPKQVPLPSPLDGKAAPGVTRPAQGTENGRAGVLGDAIAKRIGDRLLAESRILVLAPHADDETFACGGTIAKAKALGGEVFVVCVSVGDLDMYGADEPRVSGRRRIEELAEAMAVLGVDGHDVLFTDAERHMRLDALPRRDLVALFERDSRYAIDRIRPDLLILPSRCSNQDHDAVFRAGFTACRPGLPEAKAFVGAVLSADQPQLCWSPETFKPNLYVDISDFLDVKLAAHACHASQLRPPPHHGSVENLERLARLRGAEVSLEAAEAFVCHRLLC